MYDLIAAVYGKDQADRITSQIEQLIAKYDHQNRRVALSHQDVMLITYGDQVSSSTSSSLATLHTFLKQWVGELITMVHILPFYPYSSDDGFSVIDYYQVNPDLGDWDDIRSFSSDFGLMFDAVVNHISQKSTWLQGFLEGQSDYEGYFVRMGDYPQVSAVTRPRTSSLGHDFIKPDGSIESLWTTFSKDQVDLNFAEPRVFLQILDLLLYYVSNGAKAIRLDAVGFIWKESGTSCIHLPQAHQLIQVMRAVLNGNDHETLLITETNVPHAENISYFGNGSNEAHMVYNFTLPPLLAHSLLTESTTKLTAWACSLELPSQEVCFFNFLSSHDGVGVRPVEGILTSNEIENLANCSLANGGKISYKSNPDGTESPYEINSNYFSLLHGLEKDQAVASRRMILAHMIMLSFPGLPAIYFHSLFGSQNDLEGMEARGQNRSINRQKFELEALESALQEDPTRRNIFEGITRLISARQALPAFHPFGNVEFLKLDEGLFGIKRTYQKHEISCLFNLSSSSVTRISHGVGLHDVLSGKTFDGDLQALQGVWLAS